jgi:UDP-N-acetylglucosamine kinase
MAEMNEVEKMVERNAKDFIKEHKSDLITLFADPRVYKSVDNPVSLFMAGSPGAGKTEVSKGLTKKFLHNPIRIDADEIRALCPGYDGAIAHLFQSAAVKGVNILFDYALDKNLGLILDGTFAYGDAMQNIRRSLDRGRGVEIWFVYQRPELAWQFTKAREALEKRKVLKETFIQAYIKSRKNIVEAKKQFGDHVELNLLIKNIDNTNSNTILNIEIEQLDHYIGTSYTEGQLSNKLI